MSKRSKLGAILSRGYLGLFFLAGLYAVYLLVFHTATSEFCGLPAILLTQPWSLLLTPLIDQLGYVQWYERFASSPAVYGFWAMLGLLPSALLNAFLLYHFGRFLEKYNER